jgi:hypothetical protein
MSGGKCARPGIVEMRCFGRSLDKLVSPQMYIKSPDGGQPNLAYRFDKSASPMQLLDAIEVWLGVTGVKLKG